MNTEILDFIKKYGFNEIQKVHLAELAKQNANEPILNPNKQKFTVFPIEYIKIWNRYKEQLACFWKAEEIDFSGDYNDFLELSKDEQYFIEMILAFFAASDGIVNFGISERFLRDIQITEARIMYQFQTMMENVHGEVYSLMLDNIVRDKEKKESLFKAIETVPAVKEMADWAFRWIENAESCAEFLIANACVEGIMFSGAFAAIFWLKRYKNGHNVNKTGRAKSFMQGLIKSNKFISRDEGLHYEAAIDVYQELTYKVPQQRVEQIVRSAVDVAQNFMFNALPVRLIGMNSELMGDYIEYIGDRTLSMFGNKKVYNKQNPFTFMRTIGQTDKTNFFEERPHEYQDAHVMNKDKKFEVIEDF